MIHSVIFLVYALAVARVTRLVNVDRITEAPRDWLLARLWLRAAGGDPEFARTWRLDEDADKPLLVYLVTCPWCVSIYVAAVAAPIAYLWGDTPWLFVPALALAFSQVTGLLAQLGD